MESAESWFTRQTGLQVIGYAEFQALDGSTRIQDENGDLWTIRIQWTGHLGAGLLRSFSLHAGWNSP